MSKEFQQHFGNAYMHGAGSNFIGIKERQLAVGVVSYMCQGHITEHFLFFDFWM